MQIVVLNGPMSEAEQDCYIRRITAKYPMCIIDKLTLDVQGEFVDVHYTFHCSRELRKMGGWRAGKPSDWNSAKQAELRDSLPNPIE